MMALCPSCKQDAEHIEVRLRVPWTTAGVVRVEVVHQCLTWGCRDRLVEWSEPARYPEEVLRRVLEPRGMVAPKNGMVEHDISEPVVMVEGEDWRPY